MLPADLVVSSRDWFDGFLTPPEIDAMGLLDALRWPLQMDLGGVDLELDCKLVVDAIKGGLTSLHEFGSMISDGKQLFQSLNNCFIGYIRR